MSFIKRREDFVCQQCGEDIKGDGFTNHCPNCLWSKHVDIDPGDRAASCNGMMKPVEINSKDGQYRILHRCDKCGHEKTNKATEQDSSEEIIKLS